MAPAAPTGDRLEGIIRLLLTGMGVNVNSEHFRDTPARAARFYREFMRGYTVRPAEILKTFRSQSNALVIVSHIDFFSLCPRHLLVYGGKIHFAYVPNERIVGVSKIPRFVHALAARPVVQEALVADIADAFMSVVKPLGCAVKAHLSPRLCRGARRQVSIYGDDHCSDARNFPGEGILAPRIRSDDCRGSELCALA